MNRGIFGWPGPRPGADTEWAVETVPALTGGVDISIPSAGLLFEVRLLRVAVDTNDSRVYAQLSFDGGGSFLSSGYRSVGAFYTSSGGSAIVAVTDGIAWTRTNTVDYLDEGVYGSASFTLDPGSSAAAARWTDGSMSWPNSGYTIGGTFHGDRSSADGRATHLRVVCGNNLMPGSIVAIRRML